MPSTAETLQRNWAAKRLELKPERIGRIEWVTTPGWSSDATEEPESRGCDVHVYGLGVCHIDTTHLTFGELLAEVVDSAPPAY